MQILKGELELAMTLLGCPALADLDSGRLWPIAAAFEHPRIRAGSPPR